MSVSEIDATVTMDFFFRIYWVDQRLNFPDLWTALAETAPSLLVDGIELSYFLNDEEPLRIWRPDVYFNNGKETYFLAETVRLRPGGMIFWSRHAVSTLQQSLFGMFILLPICTAPGALYLLVLVVFTSLLLIFALEYQTYPQDSQQVKISAQSYGLNSNLIVVNFTDPAVPFYGYKMPKPVSLITVGGVANIKVNPMWTYLSYTTTVFNPNYGSTSSAGVKDTCIVYLFIDRQSSGVIYRLALPIMLLLLLVGLTFWSDYSQRVDSTITILLAISALYIVIFSSIPMLGYLTDFDYYIITVRSAPHRAVNALPDALCVCVCNPHVCVSVCVLDVPDD